MMAMFPGQGSQYVGMAKQLVSDHEIARRCFEEAEEACGLSLRSICFDGPEEDLKKTEITQPAILTHSIATWRVLQNNIDTSKIVFFAGHSLGEYSALVAAKVLDFSRAVYLVHRRGKFMQEAVPQGVGAMAAVLLKENFDLESFVRGLVSEQGGVCELVNYNSKQQVVIAGSKATVDEAISRLAKSGIKAIALPVSAPFHSSLMKPARVAMEPLINETKFGSLDAGVKFVPNINATCTETYQPSYLIQQIDSPVRWQQSIENVEKASCDCYLEIGPGKVLSGLARRILSNKSSKVAASEDLNSVLELFS